MGRVCSREVRTNIMDNIFIYIFLGQNFIHIFLWIRFAMWLENQIPGINSRTSVSAKANSPTVESPSDKTPLLGSLQRRLI